MTAVKYWKFIQLIFLLKLSWLTDIFELPSNPDGLPNDERPFS